MPTDAEKQQTDDEKMVEWAARKTRAQAIIAFFPNEHRITRVHSSMPVDDLIRRLRQYAHELENPRG